MENVYYALIIFAIAGLGVFWFLATSIKNLNLNLHVHSADNNERLSVLDDGVDKCMDMISKLTVKVQEHDKELEQITEIAKEAIVNWSEAGKLARKSEEDFNEGLNNILNFQPNVKQKGDEN